MYTEIFSYWSLIQKMSLCGLRINKKFNNLLFEFDVSTDEELAMETGHWK